MVSFLQENIFAIAQLSISVVTGLVAYLVYRSTRTIGKLAQTRFIIEQIQSLNMLLLNDQDLAKAIATSKSRGDHELEDPLEYKKRRSLIMLLQIGSAMYSGWKDGYVDKDIFDDFMNALVNRWAVDHKDYTLSFLDSSSSEYSRYLAGKIRESMG
ncbi:MAG: hypothetical protein AAGA21_13220 [Pseudomonadota bacterium]